MKWKACLIALCVTLSLTGCASSQYCDVASKVEPSREDVLSPETAKAILKEQKKYKEFCEGGFKWRV